VKPHPTVLLTGGTSQVGIFVLPRLLAAGYPVIALSRRISCSPGPAESRENSGLRWVHPSTVLGGSGRSRAEENGGILQEVSVLLSCGPVELAAQLATRCPRLQRVVCISSSSVHSKRDSSDAFERDLIAGIRATEDELKRDCDARRVALALLRPTLIYGCGLDQNVSRIARLARRFHFIPVAGKAPGRRQPVHADDLAKLVLGILETEPLSTFECPVAGGSVLSYREMVERIFAGLGLPVRILRIPPRLLAALVRVASWLPGAGGLNAEFVFRQNRDLIVDDAWLRNRLGFNPRAFEPTAKDFMVPQFAKILQPPE